MWGFYFCVDFLVWFFAFVFVLYLSACAGGVVSGGSEEVGDLVVPVCVWLMSVTVCAFCLCVSMSVDCVSLTADCACLFCLFCLSRACVCPGVSVCVRMCPSVPGCGWACLRVSVCGRLFLPSVSLSVRVSVCVCLCLSMSTCCVCLVSVCDRQTCDRLCLLLSVSVCDTRGWPCHSDTCDCLCLLSVSADWDCLCLLLSVSTVYTYMCMSNVYLCPMSVSVCTCLLNWSNIPVRVFYWFLRIFSYK